MAPPANTAHIVFSGTMGGGEEFAFGFWAALNGGQEAPDELQELLEDYEAAALASLTNIANTFWGPNEACRAIDLYYYAGGSTKAAGQAHSDLNVTGTGSPVFPNQIAAVVTFNTGLPGRSRRGRTYIPVTKGQTDLTASVQLTQQNCLSLCTSVRGLVLAGAGLGIQPVVASSTLGSTQLITSFKVDSKLDTQRRRAESVVSKFQTVLPVVPV